MPPYYSWRTCSGCFFCFYQRKSEWVGLKENHPQLFEEAKKYEKFNERTGERYTWSERESLEELGQPERVAEIKAKHAKLKPSARSAIAALAAAAAVRVDRRRSARQWCRDEIVIFGGTATMALDEDLAGFNINTSAASEIVLQEIMNMVWPQAFIVNNKLQPVLNSQLLDSAAVTSQSPQTVVYKINPKAVWSDGTPITADDFIYNWQAQSGNSAYTDVGGQPYDAASTAGYSQIASVVGSGPSGGAACDPGSRGRPQRRTVSERSHRHGDLQAGLRRLAEPLHQHRPCPHRPDGGMEHRLYGPDPGRLRKLVQNAELQRHQSVVLIRNPNYWGTPAKLNKLVFQFFSDESQLVPALQNKEIDIFNPSTVNLYIVQTANQVPNTTKVTLPGLQFEHIDFNQSDPYLAKIQVREAIAHGVNRQSIIARTVGQIDKGITPARQPHAGADPEGLQGHELRLRSRPVRRLLKKLASRRPRTATSSPTSDRRRARI